MERIVCEPPLETGERVQLQRAAVDDREIALDVALEVIDGYAQGLGRRMSCDRERVGAAQRSSGNAVIRRSRA